MTLKIYATFLAWEAINQATLSSLILLLRLGLTLALFGKLNKKREKKEKLPRKPPQGKLQNKQSVKNKRDWSVKLQRPQLKLKGSD